MNPSVAHSSPYACAYDLYISASMDIYMFPCVTQENLRLSVYGSVSGGGHTC